MIEDANALRVAGAADATICAPLLESEIPRMRNLLFIALAMGAVGWSSPGSAHLPVEAVGEPFHARWPQDPYARNIWDMEVFDGQLYFGAGNSSNEGPSRNAGPVPLIAYDGERFSQVFDFPEEQVDLFYTIGDQLIVPGHDTKESWAFGNYYVLQGGKWTKHRNIPRGIHVYDLLQFRGHLIAAGGSYGQPTDGWVSLDDGQSWEAGALLPNPDFATPDNPEGRFRRLWAGGIGGRFYSLLPVGQTLYLSGVMPLLPDGDGSALYRASLFEYDPAGRGFKPVRIETETIQPDAKSVFRENSLNIFPGATLRNSDVPVARKVTVVGDSTFYLGTRAHNDHQWNAFGLFAMTSAGQARRIALPDDAKIRDLNSHDGRLYILVEQPAENHRRLVSLMLVDDEGGVRTQGSFLADSFARSFEFFGDHVYFGMGSDDGDRAEAAAMTGRVLRVHVNELGH